MMNTVPFDKLGPGQSGRLAYQVLGQDGPIMNPQNIRYLSPDSAELPANALNTGASGLVAGLGWCQSHLCAGLLLQARPTSPHSASKTHATPNP